MSGGTAFLGNLANLSSELGLSTLAKMSPASVALTGGSINGVSIGASTASTGAFTTLSATSTVSLASTLSVTGATTLSNTAISASNATLTIANTGDSGLQTFYGAAYGAMWLGFTNTGSSASTTAYGGAAVAAGATSISLGILPGGRVGSTTNTSFGSGALTFRNYLDDGSGNMTVAGLATFTGSVFVGNTSVSAQGGWLQWNRKSGDGGTWLVNQRGSGSGGINFGESTTANVYTSSMFLSPTGGTSTLASSLGITGNLSVSGYASGLTQGTYGALGVLGSQNGWGGIAFNDNAGYASGVFMVSTNTNYPQTGFYNVTTGTWLWGFSGAAGGGTLDFGYVPESRITSPSQSLAASGYRQLPGGFIEQWALINVSGNTTWTFPIAFPNACTGVHIDAVFAGGAAYSQVYSTATKTNVVVNVNNGSGACPAYVKAIGY